MRPQEAKAPFPAGRQHVLVCALPSSGNLACRACTCIRESSHWIPGVIMSLKCWLVLSHAQRLWQTQILCPGHQKNASKNLHKHFLCPRGMQQCCHVLPQMGNIVNLSPPRLSDQFQISPATSPEILHPTVWRTLLFISCSDEDDNTPNFLVCFELESERVYMILNNMMCKVPRMYSQSVMFGQDPNAGPAGTQSTPCSISWTKTRTKC